MRVYLIVFLSLFSFALKSAPIVLEQNTPLLYALEVLNNEELSASGAVIIESSADELNLQFNAGFGISKTERYIRLDLSNGLFNQSFPVSGIKSKPAFDANLVRGGGIGDSYMIIGVNADIALSADTEFLLESTSFKWLDYNEPLNVQYTFYSSAAAAVNGGEFLHQITSSIAKSTVSIGTSSTRSFTHVAELTQDFKKFRASYRSPSVFSLGDASNDLASLGKVQFDNLITLPVRMPKDSTLISTFTQLLPNFNSKAKTVSITGDFSSIKAFLNTQGDCLGDSYSLTEYSETTIINVSISDLLEHPVFCVSADSKTTSIKRSAYYIDLGIGIGTSLLGEIKYDAASVDLPYITGYQNYRQRIYLVNHAGFEVAYTTHFIPEASLEGGYTEGVAAKGIIPAETTMKINASELVNFSGEGTTRISARIFIDAKPQDISAAVQILSITSSEPPVTNVLEVKEN